MQAHQASFHHHACSRQLATYLESPILCAALHELRALIHIQGATHNGTNDSGLMSIRSKPETPSHTLNLSNLGRYREIGPLRFTKHGRTSGQLLKEVCLSLGHENGFAHLQVSNVTRLIGWRKRRSKDVVTIDIVIYRWTAISLYTSDGSIE